uniref:Phospholipase A2 n=1 Tax=Amblyomma triste TaxID=251400 RepID=A0A023GBM1_AMBTT
MTPHILLGALALLVLPCGRAQRLGILTNPLGTLTNTGSLVNPVNLGTRAWDQTFGKITNTSSSDITRQLTENAIPGVQHRIITDVPLGGHKLAEIFQNSTGHVIDCNLLGDKVLIEGVLVVLPETLVTKVTPEEMDQFLDLCGTRENFASKQKSAFDYIGDIFKSLFIFPGTKWCGAGDVAKNYDDLGPSRATDACCREHDHADDSIPALEVKYGLRNTNLYTMTHCKDDRKFYGCLLNDSSVPSFTVGKLFFNILRTKCFDYTYPKTCVRDNAFYIPLVTEKCKEYRLDPSGEKQWQTFSPPNFWKDYLARKKTQTNQVRPVSPGSGQDGAAVPVTTEEPEEEPEEEPIVDAEPDNWKNLDPSEISLDATEEPVYEETTPKPVNSRSTRPNTSGSGIRGLPVIG